MHAGNAEDHLDAIGFQELHQKFTAGRHLSYSPDKSSN
jgi:hypothetical protein